MAKNHSPGFLKIVSDAKARVRECQVADVKARLDAGERFALVDVREESEYAAGHLPGATNMVHVRLPATLAELPAWRRLLETPSLSLTTGRLDPARDRVGTSEALTVELPAAVSEALIRSGAIPAAARARVS